MSFDLEVAINGLCMFVPDPAKRQMHVLMVAPAAHGAELALAAHGADPAFAAHGADPAPAAHGADPALAAHGAAALAAPGAHPAVRHYPRVFYDAVHDGETEPGYWRTVPLEDMVLDLSVFSGHGDQGPKLEDIKGLVDLRAYIKTPLTNPTKTDLPNLASRLTLPLADEIECPEPREDWELRREGDPAKLAPKAAWNVVWKIRGIENETGKLDWQLEPFSRVPPAPPIPDVPLAPLRPVEDEESGRKVVKLFISNNVREESGPPRDPKGMKPPITGTPMEHFEHFKDLYQASAVANPWPQLVYTGPTPTQRGTPYTCLSSGGH